MTAFARRLDNVTGSAIRELFKLVADPSIISFGGGNPARESFPVDTVRTLCDEILSTNGATVLQYGMTEGYMPYIDAYIEHILKPKGFMDAKRENVLALSGSMQGIDLICKVFLNPGDTILVESPTFLGALQTYNLYQANIVPVDMDDEVVVVERLEELMKKHSPKLFYCIPTFQNPTGRTLLAERRKKIAELASKYDVMVIEDDPYCELRYSGEKLPTIKSFDRTDNVILLNSFSKTLSPGIRVGAAYSSREIIRKMTIVKQSADTHSPNLTQAIAAEFLNRGMMQPHLESIIPDYAKHMNAMLEAMEVHFPKGCMYTKLEGGLFIWVTLPEGMDALEVFKRSVAEAKVAFVPGEHFFVNPAMGKNTLRLNFSAEPPEKIREGIKRLGELLETMQK